MSQSYSHNLLCVVFPLKEHSLIVSKMFSVAVSLVGLFEIAEHKTDANENTNDDNL